MIVGSCSNCYRDYVDERAVCDECDAPVTAHTQIPAEVLEAIEYEVARTESDYADTFRAYRVSDRALWPEFKRLRDGGCCGSAESSYIDSAGDKWVIGWNYGH